MLSNNASPPHPSLPVLTTQPLRPFLWLLAFDDQKQTCGGGGCGSSIFLGKVVTILQKSPDAVPQIAVGAEYKKSYGRLKKVLAP